MVVARAVAMLASGVAALGCGLDIAGQPRGDAAGRPDASVSVDPPADTARVADGLLALYTFAGGDGGVVEDVSGVAPRLDLLVETGRIEQRASEIAVAAPARLSSAGPATKLIDAIRRSNELTVEAWVTPSLAVQTGPARIVSISENPSVRDATLGCSAAGYVFRLRTTASDTNGSGNGGETVTAPPPTTARTHVVFTRTTGGARRLYRDGVATELPALGGTLDWDTGHRLHLANEGTDDRPWLGVYHLVAVYGRALGEAEVSRNFRAGP